MGESGAEKRGKIGAEGRGESSHSFFFLRARVLLWEGFMIQYTRWWGVGRVVRRNTRKRHKQGYGLLLGVSLFPFFYHTVLLLA